jgi:hypothetical protein
MSLKDYLELDDGVLWGAMHAWEQCDDPALSEITRRIRARELFKTLELFGDQATVEGRERALEQARQVIANVGKDPDVFVGLDVATNCPFSTENQPMVVYAKGPARPLGEVSFLLGRLLGQELTRTRLVFPGEYRDEIIRAVGV